MSRLRLVHIVTKLDPGGAERGVLYSLANLNRSLFEPHLIAGPGGLLDEQAMQVPDTGVQFCGELSLEPRPLADHDTFVHLRSMLRELKPDIVHTHRSRAGIVGRLAASAENVPMIVHTYHRFAFHPFQDPGVFKLAVALDREACRRSHHLAFVCEANLRLAQELDLIQNKNTSIIRTGVEIDPLLEAKRSEEFRSQFDIGKKSKVVGMIGYLRPQKDPLTFVEAAALVTRKRPSVKFLLFGEGALQDAVQRRANKILKEQNFLMAGWGHSTAEVMANLDLLVVPSLWEGLPRVIPEATIAGVPVIASNVDGNLEVIQEGRNGAFAEPQNPEDFAKKILQALKEDWKVDAELSRQIQHEYDIRGMLHGEESIYLDLAAKRVS